MASEAVVRAPEEDSDTFPPNIPATNMYETPMLSLAQGDRDESDSVRTLKKVPPSKGADRQETGQYRGKVQKASWGCRVG